MSKTYHIEKYVKDISPQTKFDDKNKKNMI